MLGSLFAAAQPALKITRLQMASALPPMGPGTPENGVATLSAQPTGLMAWLQNLFGAGKTSTVTITNHRITRVDQSKSTRDSVVMPLGKASTFHYGFKKPPFVLVIFGALFVLLGLITMITGGFAAAMPFVLFGGVSAGSYFMASGSYYLIFSSVSGLAVTLKLKTKDPEELDRLCDLAFEAVRVSEQGGSPASAYRAA